MTDILPRHILCFLGKAGDFERLSAAAHDAIAKIGDGFEFDSEFSEDEPDDRMERSFAVCWDRVYPEAWEEKDEEATISHGCVIYIIRLNILLSEAVSTSYKALQIIDHMIVAGAIAVKGESAGVAHGIDRWRALVAQADAAHAAGDMAAVAHVCRLALTKRPLDACPYYETLGNHLVGIPEICIQQPFVSELAAVGLMDEVGDMLSTHSLDKVLEEYKGRHVYDNDYDEDGPKFNPYGAILLNERDDEDDEEGDEEEEAPEPQPEPKLGFFAKLFS